ncbi:hypothetical protein HOS79_gp084 [Lactobacillus phage Nyseid]|uniref:Uncharacterized protein n=1 Tax=Lactobacillus phage Nyseid TaxID=2079432 RepID=A0A2K9VCG3_9CAUD|nr:hypothetical protein HOS79_gp084 [Lactobacillus phage Nyseid]AUV59885.1 hypothetical protein [Lactobacillus phage Nyseid]
MLVQRFEKHNFLAHQGTLTHPQHDPSLIDLILTHIFFDVNNFIKKAAFKQPTS